MNKTEIKGYNWLISNGYSTDDIKFQSNKTPDFLTSDGKGWEIKRIFAGNKIFMSMSQFKRLKQMVDTHVVIFNDESELPIFIIISNKITVGKIHDEIIILVPKNIVTKSVTITDEQHKFIEENNINLSKFTQRILSERMRAVKYEQKTNINYTVNINVGT